MRRALDGIHRQFREKKPLRPEEKGSWRRRKGLFKQPQGEAPPLGVPVFSPALFPAGHSVSSFHLLHNLWS